MIGSREAAAVSALTNPHVELKFKTRYQLATSLFFASLFRR